MKTPSLPFSQAVLALSAILGVTHFAAAATDTWTGFGTDAYWSTAGNWTGVNTPPLAGDSLIFGPSSPTILTNDLTAGTAFNGLTFVGGAPGFNFNGNSILLSGNAFGNFNGIVNNSGVSQGVNLNLNLDWGYYTFSGVSASGLGLNGTLNPSSNGVAFFDPNVTSVSLATDSAGLISGLGGQGLMFNGSVPTGLATINAGSILAYTAYTTLATPGAIASGANNNINLTASGVTGTYTAANGVTVNTISAAQAGTQTSTLTIAAAGTLTLGQHGGIFALASGTNPNALTVAAGAGGNLTAGTTAGATIVFGTHTSLAGNSPPNVMTVSAVIKDNPGGGVTVVKVGNSSMVINGANTYSAGTYLLQGQIQMGANATALGSGPIYIAQGATLLNNIGPGTVANNIFLSSGNGSTLWNGVAANPGGLVYCFADGNYFYNGVLTLLGAPVPSASYPPTAGCRIIGNKDAGALCIFQNQITGTGTLDFCASPHADFFEFSNNPNNHPANNWSGGLIIEQVLPSPSSARNITVQLEFNNQIPSGASAGNVTLYNADASSFHSLVLLDLNGHTNTINGLNSSSVATVPQLTNSATAAALLTVGANNASGNYNGLIGDTGHITNNFNLVKIGSGTQTFSSALTYHGSTTVSNGTLALSGGGSIANSSLITVKSGATLDASGAGGLIVGAAQTLNCVGTVVGSTTINGTVMSVDAIGTLTNTGNVSLNGGGTFVWDVNNLTSAAGGDPGSSLLNITGGLQINSSSGSPFNINITSLTAGDVPGNAANFNPSINGSWILATTTSGITGFTGSGQFNPVTSAFSNAPASSAQWSVGISGNNLVLFFTSSPVITNGLVSITNNAGSTATFTVQANGANQPLTFQWFQGATLLSNGSDPSGSGATITITTTTHTSTLTIGGTGVQDTDAGGYTVNVTNNIGAGGTSSATLSIIDPPSNLNVSQSAYQSAYVNGAAGGIITLSATANGTATLTYVWSLNGTALATNTTGIFNVNVSEATVGTYTVVVSNPAGSVTNSSVVVTPVTQVPNQLVYEPFNYAINNPAGGAPWTAFGVTNIFNQATGVGLSWLNSGSANQPATLAQDMRIEPGYNNSTYSPNGDSYPWPGLAGNSPQELYCNVNSFVRLPLGAGGSISSGTVYFSCVIHIDQGAGISTVGTDNFCGFGNGSSTTPNTAIYIKTPGDDTYIPGIFKTSGGTGALSPGVNGAWSAKAYHRGQIVFVIARLTINPGAGNDTFDLWLAPTNSSFGASEANLPTPDVTGVGGSAADVGNVDFFFIRNTAQPFSRRFADLRIGRTWASVTPPSAPTLSLANVVLAPGVTNAVFASQNAGNPVDTYQWQFNGGPALTDGPTGNGSTITGSSTATLTITGATAADAGVYTVTGSNTDPSNDGVIANLGTLTGSASATLTFAAPRLSVAYSAPNLTLSWPTNFTGYTLENALALTATWTTNSSPPYPVVGTNYTVSVNAASGTLFFRLIK